MQLYAVARGFPGKGEEEVAAALREAAAHFPELDDGTLERGASRDRRLAYAAIAHAPDRAGPRRYFARREHEVLMYDGLPLPVYDAEALLDAWGETNLEGIFSAVRLDLAEAGVECLLDVLGMAKVFVARRAGGFAISNSVEALRILTGASEPDPLGVASMVGLGWPAGGRTLLREVELLESGHLHDLARGRSTPYLTPRSVAPANNRSRRTVADVADELTGLAKATAAFPLAAGLTAGRDTRVVLALALAAGLDVSWYTSGHPTDIDVILAQALARELGLRHEMITPHVPEAWADATSAFSAQTDGLATFWIVADWVEHQHRHGPLELKLWGPGGEVGRAGNIGLSIPFGANVPGLRASAEVQRRILHRKVAHYGGLLTPAARATTTGYLDGFTADRIAEGWRPRELGEAYYGFERVRHWASAGVRRASVASDLWSPFVSRAFIEYCWSLTPGERCVEAPHWRLLTHLDERVRDLPYEYPWRPQRPKRASAMVLRDVAAKGLAKATRRAPAAPAPRPFGLDWVEAGKDQIAAVVAGTPRSALWDMVDRERLQELLAGDRAARAPVAEGLTRALTVLWWLHGRHA